MHSSFKRLLFSISVAYLIATIAAYASNFIDGNFGFYAFLLAPPILFSLAIIIAFKTRLRSASIFFFLSILIFAASFFLATLTMSYRIEWPGLLLWPSMGAILEILLFSWVYGRIKNLTVMHLIFGFFIGSFFFLIDVLPAPSDNRSLYLKFVLYLGLAIWYFGTANVMYLVYNREKK